MSKISSKEKNVINKIFGRTQVIIGVVHCPPMPGSPRYKRDDFKYSIDAAVTDAMNYIDGGVDGLIIENHGDIPFVKPGDIGYEVAAGLAVITDRIRQRTDVPLGINVLANAARPALAIAKTAGAAFVRVNQWANAYVANEGFVEGEAASALRYRAAIAAEDVAIFADAHVKHGSHAIVADRSVTELVRDVAFFDADAVICTGQRTGDAAALDEIQTMRDATSLPLLVGSGVTPDNVGTMLPLLDGLIIASALKVDGVWWNPVERDRVEAFMNKVHAIRPAA
ncbi:BtpA/SgcQ family protein [Mesorhizobium sp. BR1-1-16]|uniref:BtpA/SgcQ family protein n=1 Tax=Mesorhizobium sp. BR1-1-16 TaxID=2876653 RepID=UPI001CCA0521|nr:BtpA/SgcQ family protein [Mesorhizobium sp. BR1-1-16]MBZ9938811.1 BtpA/SgcQ family protein [Mesorhizobium sp. BR1-1-16]